MKAHTPIILQLGLSFVVLVAAQSQAQNLILNGSFESPGFVNGNNGPGRQQYVAPSAAIAGWTIGGTGDVFLHKCPDIGIVGSTFVSAQDGVYYLDLSGSGPPHGTILQDFPTTLGTSYLLSFYIGASGQTPPAPTINVQVTGASSLLNKTLSPPAASSNITWRLCTFTFRANSMATRLSFVGTSGGDDNSSYVDNVSIIAQNPSARTLPDYQPDPADGRQAVKNFQMTPGGQCSFIFSTADPGSICHISWTNNLRQWFPLLQFNATTAGTEVVDFPQEPSKFYRATYLPTGVSAADSFDYPIGSGSVPEQITPERNTLYPGGAVGSPDREAVAPVTSNWYNAQDVGSYYAEYSETQGKWLWEGLHPGEDWNKANDVGENVRAIANGQVIEIRPAGASGIPSTSGYAVVIRHWLPNGDSVDSFYVHIAPNNNGGVIGAESEFTYQVGEPVTKGSIIGVVGAVSALPPHLHFELRNKPFNVSGSLWPKSTGDAYYGPEVGLAGNRSPSISQSDVEAAFRVMQEEGIIDPSDFIDDHR
ncbi:MAG: peptidoglycan DD-metalloendopeptidase family protein [bacterium]